MAVFAIYPTDLILFFSSFKAVLSDNIYGLVRFTFWDSKKRDIWA